LFIVILLVVALAAYFFFRIKEKEKQVQGLTASTEAPWYDVTKYF
jgi:hypothetical protein